MTQRIYHSAPALLAGLLIFVSKAPWIHFFYDIVPLFACCVIFYWALYQRALMPYWVCFVLGFISDVIYGAAFGLFPTLYIALRYAVMSQRALLFRQIFIGIWFIFALIMLVFEGLYWAGSSLFTHQPLSPLFFILQWGSTVLFYPLMHLLNTWLYRLLR